MQEELLCVGVDTAHNGSLVHTKEVKLSTRASQKNIQGSQWKKRLKNSKIRPKNSTIKPLPGGGGARGKNTEK